MLNFWREDSPPIRTPEKAAALGQQHSGAHTFPGDGGQWWGRGEEMVQPPPRRPPNAFFAVLVDDRAGPVRELHQNPIEPTRVYGTGTRPRFHHVARNTLRPVMGRFAVFRHDTSPGIGRRRGRRLWRRFRLPCKKDKSRAVLRSTLFQPCVTLAVAKDVSSGAGSCCLARRPSRVLPRGALLCKAA